MKKTNIFNLVLLSFILTILGCKSDGDRFIFNGFNYDGKSYPTEQIQIVPMAQNEDGLFEYYIQLISESIDIESPMSGQTGHFILFNIFSQNMDKPEYGIYDFEGGDNTRILSESIVILEFTTPNTYGTVIYATDGRIIIDEDPDYKYAINYNLTLSNGKKISGQYFIDAD